MFVGCYIDDARLLGKLDAFYDRVKLFVSFAEHINTQRYVGPVKTLHKHNLAVILGTPSAAPPPWLSMKYPDIFEVNDKGERLHAGGRRFTCPTNPQYRKLSLAIASQMAKKFADEETRMNVDKKEIEREAKAAEAVRDRNQKKDPYFDYAEVLLQIAIVTASISILSSSRPMFWFSLVLAISGTLLSANGFTLLVHVPFFEAY